MRPPQLFVATATALIAGQASMNAQEPPAPFYVPYGIETICLRVEEIYPQIEGNFSLRVADAVRSLLAGAGFDVVGEGDPCDAAVSLSLTVPARGYWSRDGRYVFTTAGKVEGSIRLESPGHHTREDSIKTPSHRPVQFIHTPSGDSVTTMPELARRVMERELYEPLLEGLADCLGFSVAAAAVEQTEDFRRRILVFDFISERGSVASDDEAHALFDLLRPFGAQDKDLYIDYAYEAIASLKAAASEVIPYLIEGTQVGDRHDRYTALEGLGRYCRFAPGQVIPALSAALDDGSVNQAAFLSFERSCGPDGVTALIEALRHPNPIVRRDAARYLGRAGPRASAAVPALTEALGDEEVEAEAERALGQIAKESSTVDSFAEPRRRFVREYERRFTSRCPLSRRTLAVQIGRIFFRPHADEVVPTLIDALEDEDVRLRELAAESLRVITGEDFGEDPAAWRSWWANQHKEGQ